MGGKSPLLIKTLEVGDLGACCYIVADVASKRAAIIDPGANAKRIIETVEAQSLKPAFIINTHGHVDHIGANNKVRARYPEAALCIHALDAPMLGRPSTNLSFFVGGSYKSVAADRLLEDGDELPLDGIVLKVLHTPGHTPGSISLHAARQHVCFTGDLLFAGSVGRSDFPGGSEKALLESIRQKILVLPDDTAIYPGHGPATTVGEERKGNPYV